MNALADHLSPNDDLDLHSVSSSKLRGGSEKVIKVAPSPAIDYSELPNLFVATIFANTFDPQGRLKGATRKTLTGIVHSAASLIVGSDP